MRRNSRSSNDGRENGDLETNKKCEDAENLKKPKENKISLIKDILIDYMNNANLHGLKYISEKDRNIVEKIFWTMAFFSSVMLCGYLIRALWIKWDMLPVIVTFAETTIPVWQIPYPAVTLCFETKAMATKYNFTASFHIYNKTENRINMTEDDRNMYEDLTLVCDDYLANKAGRKFSDAAETVRNIKAVAPNVTEQFFGCRWQGILKETCEHLFSPILTEEGLCYSFNTLSNEELFRLENLHKDYPYLDIEKARPQNVAMLWDLENGYPAEAPIDTYPRRGAGFGAKTGLTFLMKTKEINLDYLCKGPVQGFKILFHNPAELPRLSQTYFRSPLSQEVVVAVKPKVITTSEALKTYPPTRRQCYFPYERYLKYFKVYTQSNCEMECLTNFTHRVCGCVHFGLPHSADINVCNTASVDCMKAAHNQLVVADIEEGLKLDINNDTDHLLEARQIARQCQCLPACNSIDYESENSQADFDWRAIYRAFRYDIPDNETDMMYSRVFVFFKEPQFMPSRRSELYGLTDFLANCGGLLGLFMGFSVLSVIEILYFFTIKFCCMIRRRRNDKKLEIC